MTQPLQAKRVVIPRAEGRGEGLAARLRTLGAEPVLYPVIAYAPPEDGAALQLALLRLMRGEFDWLVLTSVEAVNIISQRAFGFRAANPLRHNERRTKIAVVGPATGQACIRLLNQTPALMPAVFTADTLANKMGDLRGQHVLLLNADIAQPKLQQALQAAGATVERVIAYRTVPAKGNDIDMPALLRTNAVHAILFTSGSTVRCFLESVGLALLDEVNKLIIVCIGPSTAAVAHQAGLQVDAVAEEATEAGLIKALYGQHDRG
jgi:uroporphyrinogen-III synthase